MDREYLAQSRIIDTFAPRDLQKPARRTAAEDSLAQYAVQTGSSLEEMKRKAQRRAMQ